MLCKKLSVAALSLFSEFLLMMMALQFLELCMYVHRLSGHLVHQLPGIN